MAAFTCNNKKYTATAGHLFLHFKVEGKESFSTLVFLTLRNKSLFLSTDSSHTVQPRSVGPSPDFFFQFIPVHQEVPSADHVLRESLTVGRPGTAKQNKQKNAAQIARPRTLGRASKIQMNTV